MNRFASTRSEKRAVQPEPPRAQCSVGSIEEDGMRYGLTTHALIASTIAIAPAIVTIQSMIPRHGCGTPSRTSGFSPCFGGGGGDSCGAGRLGHSSNWMLAQGDSAGGAGASGASQIGRAHV